MEFEIGKLIETVGVSISEAQHELERHAMQRFFHYFESVPSGNSSAKREWNPQDAENMPKEEWETQIMQPVTAKILVPCEEDLSKKTVAEVPLVALASHMQVQLDKVTVKVNTRFVTDSGGSVKMDINAPVTDGINSFDDPENGAGNAGAVEMVFHVAGRPEGKSRVMQNMERIL